MPTAPSGPVLSAAAALVQGLRPGSGDNWLGFCPIHGEDPRTSTRSFSFNAATGYYHCFAGCGGGGFRKLLVALRKSDAYIERALAHVVPHLRAPKQRVLTGTSGRLFRTGYPLPEKLLGLFEYAPESLLRDGFDEHVLRANDVGFDIERGRVTYAIRDLDGTLAGIAGKPVGQEYGGSKYIVYKHELRELGFRDYHFNNHRFVWGWEQFYPVVYQSVARPTVCLTEGYKARLWLVQHGFPYTGALMGTGLSPTQQMFVERLGARVVLCLDNDVWGRLGTSKICYKLRGLDVAVMRYPYPEVEKMQPDDLTENELRGAIENPMTVRQWRHHYHEHRK